MQSATPHALIAVDGLADEHLAEVADVLDGWATWERIGEKTAADVFAKKLRGATIHLGWGRLPEHVRDQEARRWQRPPPYREVTGTTACVVGLGDIGTELARRCIGLGMDVVGVRGDPRKGHEVVQKIYPSSRIAEAVAGADHVFLALPETSATRGLFDDALLARMKPGACLYNLARGPILDEEALLERLTSGHLGGAGLDVFDEEPLPPEHPLWGLENVLITPHAGGRSVREHDRLVALFTENLRRHREGAPLLNYVPL